MTSRLLAYRPHRGDRHEWQRRPYQHPVGALPPVVGRPAGRDFRWLGA